MTKKRPEIKCSLCVDQGMCCRAFPLNHYFLADTSLRAIRAWLRSKFPRARSGQPTAGAAEEQDMIRDLYSVIEDIDAALGKGYAKKHPELIGQLILAHELDALGTTFARSFPDGTMALLAENVRTDHPLQSSTLEDIGAGIARIADGLERLMRK